MTTHRYINDHGNHSPNETCHSSCFFISSPLDDSSSSDSVGEFQIHRKMLRRRHVRKEQKEKARRRKEQEQQKLCQQQNQENGEMTASTIGTISAPCSPSMRLVEGGEQPLSSSPSRYQISAPSPPPQTAAFQLPASPPTYDERIVPSRVLVPTFSPLRSRKRRSDLF
jgi:hypothetical protein